MPSVTWLPFCSGLNILRNNRRTSEDIFEDNEFISVLFVNYEELTAVTTSVCGVRIHKYRLCCLHNTCIKYVEFTLGQATRDPGESGAMVGSNSIVTL